MKKNLSLLLLVLLTACSGSDVKSSLGLKKQSPDEFMVLSKPALTVPPSFDLPEPISAPVTPPKDFSANNAKKAVFGDTPVKNTPPLHTHKTLNKKDATAENLFLNKAGADQPQGNIREEIESDIRAEQPPAPEQEESKGFFSRLFEPVKLDDKPDPIVNPTAEKDRIKGAQQQGQKVDGSGTATIQPKGETTLDKIF